MNDMVNIQCRPTPTLFVRKANVSPPAQNIPLAASDADVAFAGSDSAGDLTGSD